jgi:hypothetical protein
MVFQGTVFGPMLWNMFYEDARHAIQEMSFDECVFADDLNAHRIFAESTPNAKILNSLTLCQEELHDWGKANQVAFDPGKEGFYILSNSEAYGDDFKILGVEFDTSLTMRNAVDGLVGDAGWKLRMLTRTRRFYTDAELIVLYKSHMLSFVEYRTPAIYHASRDILRRLDRVQSKFLEDAGADEVTALLEFNLAPLASRRDIAMLGLLHRTMLGKGPPHFKKYFKMQGSKKMEDPRASIKGPLLVRSILGLVAVYNMLPIGCRNAKTVKDFQHMLQGIIKEANLHGGM